MRPEGIRINQRILVYSNTVRTFLTRGGLLGACALLVMLGNVAPAAHADVEGPKTSSCPAEKLIVVRGSMENPGTDNVGDFMRTIADHLNTSNGVPFEGLAYPAASPGNTLRRHPNREYDASVAKGTTTLITKINEISSKCHEEKILLLGWSQGAQVIGNALVAGATEPTQNPADSAGDALTSSSRAAIAAVALFGDPTRNFDQSTGKDYPYNRGTAVVSAGVASRDEELEPADKVYSYCDLGDLICSSAPGAGTHHGYVQKYASEVETIFANALDAEPTKTVEP